MSTCNHNSNYLTEANIIYATLARGIPDDTAFDRQITELSKLWKVR